MAIMRRWIPVVLALLLLAGQPAIGNDGVAATKAVAASVMATSVAASATGDEFSCEKCEWYLAWQYNPGTEEFEQNWEAECATVQGYIDGGTNCSAMHGHFHYPDGEWHPAECDLWRTTDDCRCLADECNWWGFAAVSFDGFLHTAVAEVVVDESDTSDSVACTGAIESRRFQPVERAAIVRSLTVLEL